VAQREIKFSDTNFCLQIKHYKQIFGEKKQSFIIGDLHSNKTRADLMLA
jgi:hypothetical protein